MKKNFFIHSLRRNIKRCQFPHKALFIISGGTVQGDIVMPSEYYTKDISFTENDSSYIHMLSLNNTLNDNAYKSIKRNYCEYTPEFTETDVIILENVTLNIGGILTRLKSLLLFPEEIIGMTAIYQK